MNADAIKKIKGKRYPRTDSSWAIAIISLALLGQTNSVIADAATGLEMERL